MIYITPVLVKLYGDPATFSVVREIREGTWQSTSALCSEFVKDYFGDGRHKKVMLFFSRHKVRGFRKVWVRREIGSAGIETPLVHWKRRRNDRFGGECIYPYLARFILDQELCSTQWVELWYKLEAAK